MTRFDATVKTFETTVTSKGQITIPASLRASWLLKEGDKVEFYAGLGGETLVRPLNAKPTAVFADFPDEVMVACTASDDEAIAEGITARDSRTGKTK
jgi:antitoxin PrlF